MNTDGCQVSNSSRSSAWPVYVELNELPPHMRKKYMLLAAIFVDDQHPKTNNLLRPFTIELRKLFNKGITWRPTETTKVTSKFIVVACSLDAPARASVVRIKQFNDYFGCPFCYAKGTSLSPGRFIYPFDQCYGKLRTDDELISDMKFVTEEGVSRHGVKGYSALIALPLFSITKGVVVEAMHAAFLGAAKLHTTILMTTTNAFYYIGSSDALKIIDKTLLSIKPPSRRARTPRSIKFYAQWKASEWRNWLSYAPACLAQVLEEKYVNHLALLSEAMHYLNNDSITLPELNRTDMLLKKYVQLFEEFFGIAKMTSNIHSLTHLTLCVRNWGPCWAHDAFIFEAWNRNILESVSSPNAREDQIATRFLMQRFLNHSSLDDSIASKTKAYIFKTLKVFDETVQTGSRDKFIFEGKPTIRSLTRDESIVLRAAGYTPEKITIYGRMQLNKIKFSSVNPQLQTKISDSFIFNERDGVFYEIKKIVSFKIDNNLISGLIVRSFSHDYYGFETQFISAVVENKLSFIHETNRIRPAIKINTNGVTYAIKLANCWETD